MLKKILPILLLWTAPLAAADPPPPGHSGIKPISEIPYYTTSVTRSGWEERTKEFRKWLSTGVRIGGGSGTMTHYQKKGNWMYIISCGHLFEQTRRSAEYYKENPRSATIEVFYKNDKKLSQPESFKAQVLCHVWMNGAHDVSLLRFHPDWQNPRVSPMVPVDYKGSSHYHSIGCDGRSEVAHYLVKHVQRRINGDVYEIVTTENSPRGGRSGGGLLNDKGELLGICSRAGGGYGYFSDWKQIHAFLEDEGYGFVLKRKSHQFRIIDRNNPQGIYDDDYYAFPQN